MKRSLPFIVLLAAAILVGVVVGVAIKPSVTGKTPAATDKKAVDGSASVSKKIGFKSVDVAGEISAEISPFKAGITGTYVEVNLMNITSDRVVDLEYIKVVFFDGKGAFLDYGEGRVGKTLKPGEGTSSFLYITKGKPPAFYNENAKKVGFDRIGSSEPCRRTLQQL